jgi:hypothetical protein
MFKNIILALVFSILMNWCISMQMLNQVSQSKNIKLIAVAIAVVTAFIAGYVILLGL